MNNDGLKDEHLLLLGRIDGTLQGVVAQQNDAAEALKSIDARLRDQEQRSVKLGGISGGVVSVGMALLIEGLKGWLKGPGQSS